MANKPLAQTYNLVGTVVALTAREMQDGRPWITFQLARESEPNLDCVAFGDVARAFTGRFTQGSEILVYGWFEARAFTRRDGTPGRKTRLHVLWTGERRRAPRRPLTRSDRKPRVPTREPEAKNSRGRQR